MEYILNLLNKIKWDKRLRERDFSVIYTDRVEDKYKEIPYSKIKRIEGTFIVLDMLDEETYIPLHRIRGVKKQGLVVWKR